MRIGDTPLANGITSAMPMSLSTVRGSHLGSRRGQRSSHPNTNRMALPTITARSTIDGQGAFLAGRVSKPKAAETTSVKRSRGHAKMRLKPLGTVAAVDAMA